MAQVLGSCVSATGSHPDWESKYSCYQPVPKLLPKGYSENKVVFFQEGESKALGVTGDVHRKWQSMLEEGYFNAKEKKIEQDNEEDRW